MATVLSQKTFTIKKIINGRTLHFSLVVKGSDTQVYIPDQKKYNPDYTGTGTALQIMPKLMVSGKGDMTSALSGLAYSYEDENGKAITANSTATGAWLKTAANGKGVNITSNLSGCQALKVTCTATYTDADNANMKTTVVASATIQKIENTGSNILCVIEQSAGDSFSQELTTLKFTARMMRGATEDTENVAYAWYILKSGTWTAISALTDKGGMSGYSTQTLTITRDDVTNMASLKCVITDTDTATNGRTPSCTGYVTVYDNTDPYEIHEFMPQGDALISGGSTTVNFKIWQGTGYVTDSNFFAAKTMRVFRYTASGVIDTTWGTSGYKACTADANNSQYKVAIAYSDLLTGVATAFGVELQG